MTKGRGYTSQCADSVGLQGGVPAGQQDRGDDPHGLLGVVCAVPNETAADETSCRPLKALASSEIVSRRRSRASPSIARHATVNASVSLSVRLVLPAAPAHLAARPCGVSS
jgi:hypothetical protein